MNNQVYGAAPFELSMLVLVIFLVAIVFILFRLAKLVGSWGQGDQPVEEERAVLTRIDAQTHAENREAIIQSALERYR